MLAVLPPGAGRRARRRSRTRCSGQGSIFDLGEPAPAGGPAPFAAPHHPPVPALASSTAPTRCAMEKETLGMFLSSHPLADVRGGAARAGRLLARRARRQAGRRVGHGRRHRSPRRRRSARSRATPMMFATLDDLEGQVEMLIFNSAYAANADKIGVDKGVIVRGRVDHKERGETKLVVQEVEVFEPTPRGDRAGEGRCRPLRVGPAQADHVERSGRRGRQLPRRAEGRGAPQPR